MTSNKIKAHHDACEARKMKVNFPYCDGESHRLNWKHAGLDCMLVRNQYFLHWCGYVGVDSGHKFFNKNYNAVDVGVHGGLTYSEFCGGYVCHITEDKEEKTWWFGFDCAHFGDLNALELMVSSAAHWVYRTEEYVKKETERLAEQLRDI